MACEALFHDLRIACRGLRRTSSFSVVAVLTLALGIGGTTLVFALIRGVLLRPLPVLEAERVIVAWKESRASGFAGYPFGDTEIQSVAEGSRLLETVAGVTRNGVARAVLTDNGVSTYANVALVTGGFFDVLGVEPVLGRTLARGDEKPGAEKVIVISSGLWRRQYGGKTGIVGRRVVLGEQSVAIVGVIPSDLDYPTGVEIWQTTSSVSSSDPFAEASRREVNLVGRLRPGVTLDQVSSEMAALTRQLDAAAPAHALRGLTPVISSFTDEVLGNVRPGMLALFGAVAVVLLIAVTNVANLLLLRGENRAGDFAVRAALGGTPIRLMREVLWESLVLAVIGGIAGFAVAWWALGTVTQLVPDGLPRIESIYMDWTVTAFSTGIVFVTALLAGLAPALATMRHDLVARLSRRASVAGRSAAGRRVLVIAQVALAVTVVAAAGLLLRSMLRLQSVDLGLAAERLVLLDLHIPQAKYAESARHAQFLDAAITQLETVPLVSSATPVNVSPFSGQGWDLPRFVAEGQTAEQAARNPSLNLESIHPNYFETFEVAILRGRTFTAADRDGAVQVAIVSEDLAAQVWPGEDPIGKRLRMGDFALQAPWSHTVVGVSAPTRYRTIAGHRPTLYLPAAQFQMTATMLVVRTTASFELLASLARERMRKVDPDVRIMRIATFGELANRPLARPRFNAYVLDIFASVALLLSTVGLYAVMAAYVRQRDREIALRLALGAAAGRIRLLVLGEALWLTAVGTIIGLLGAAVAAHSVRSLLFEVHPLDPLSMIVAAALLTLCSTAACYVPVRRALRLDAATLLRG